ncbi:hypothetical protein HMPREF0620_0421 [Parascardovia denticolens DSM 10105 = JCM 12538]|uniref:Uncharacterized protein n=1 Tax=Parascardovia denticolens DSM 10105 = JCM 12538 TaxID=864564 RepID=E6K0T5_PARDN|nr:hypothetical protein [Parascardovia denticolens]EFG33036.2 hypothetical protein HMPREF9017_00445 [Parascardovia denticolens F0305]EFT83416.1 hypothetical protein HMPREF0620_0421 [Parascardovia denticolens DSM 10105 = JCM 12538]BAR05694.1 conserved hypothetical protein [Parascardovia denticolens DSM 10105 = JCM 12538]
MTDEQEQETSPFADMPMRGRVGKDEGRVRRGGEDASLVPPETAGEDQEETVPGPDSMDHGRNGEGRSHSGRQDGKSEDDGQASQQESEGQRGPEPQEEDAARSRSHRNRLIVSLIAILLIVAAVVTAFLWPGWALKKKGGMPTNQVATTSANATPTIPPQPLPSNASALVKAVLPDSSGTYSRQSVTVTQVWESSQPIEEYVATYSNGVKGQEMTVTVAQWSTSDYALKQYQAISGQLTGKQIATGNVVVNGSQTGSYTVHEDAKDPSRAVAVEQNATALFQMTGPKDRMTDFFAKYYAAK